MTSRLLRYLMALTIAAGAALLPLEAAASSPRSWEEISTPPRGTVMQTDSQADSDISAAGTAGGYVYITVRQTSTVKIFTILGQLIVQQQLKPGTYRLRIESKGVYLLKAGSVTRRVAV